MLKVLITGATGFLGSHITEALIEHEIEVFGLKREMSDTWRLTPFMAQINWINLDPEGEWEGELVKISPDVIIHSAWIGVEAQERENWDMQSQNIDFLLRLLKIAAKVNLSKFIFLGSQSEYGLLDGVISEEQATIASNAYGSIKLACSEISKTFCSLNDIDWIWLRVFSVFGEKENGNWLIPSLIRKAQTQQEMDLTLGEQKYAYLYSKDFSNIILKMVLQKIISGIYNVSSTQAIKIKDLISAVRDEINPDFKLNFGALPYRNNQSMHIQGDISKLQQQIGIIEFTDFNVALQHTLNDYLNS